MRVSSVAASESLQMWFDLALSMVFGQHLADRIPDIHDASEPFDQPYCLMPHFELRSYSIYSGSHPRDRQCSPDIHVYLGL